MAALRDVWIHWRIRRMLKLTTEERLDRITRVSRRRHRRRQVAQRLGIPVRPLRDAQSNQTVRVERV